MAQKDIVSEGAHFEVEHVSRATGAAHLPAIKVDGDAKTVALGDDAVVVDLEAGTVAIAGTDVTELASDVSDLADDVASLTTDVAGLVPDSRAVASGGGLTGGGDLSADRTLAVGAGAGIVVNADDVAVDFGEVGDLAKAGAVAAAGVLDESARADHAHQINAAAYMSNVVTGLNGAGAVTLTGAKVGDKVLMLTNLTDAANGASSFEATITIADQIQQSDVADLSTKKFAILLLHQS